MNIIQREVKLEPANNQRLISLCGPHNDNLKQRDNGFVVIGDEANVEACQSILQSLYEQTLYVNYVIDVKPEQVHLAIIESGILTESKENLLINSLQNNGKLVSIKTKSGVIKPRTPNQAKYINNIFEHDITFGIVSYLPDQRLKQVKNWAFYPVI